jgi:putative hydrolase of the HAD superfamily
MCLGMTIAVNHLRVRSAWISASARLRSAAVIRAVLWDFGGVILSSPFEAFNRYEEQAGLPNDFIRTVNATEPHSNAWARLERSEVSLTDFDELFAVESRRLGHEVRGAIVLDLLHGEIRPEMVEALRRVRAAGLATACLTNNVVSDDDAEHPDPTGRREQIAVVMAMFDAIVESSKVGVRKPEPRFYEIACDLLDVQPVECVFLDDLGINLKPAAAMGMTTIKVLNAAQALADLEQVLAIPLR